MIRFAFTILLIQLGTSTVFSQFNTNPNQFQNNSFEPDTSFDESDTLVNKSGLFSIFKGKPGKAALFSLIIPAGGQIYNKKWWKVPLALAIDGGLTYVLITNRSNYHKTQDAYQIALATPGAENVSSLKQQRDFYRKWSEYAWIWLIGGHILTVADAYVDRHLMDFDVSDDLTYNNIYLRSYESLSVFKLGFKISLNSKINATAGKIVFSAQ
ncbi:MAG: DUF5683 domain-containing protein [Saprospiraceae bacterium]|jgi:hypothetical protein|nr:hypothetical protein [Saprospiraceae bacterium]